MTQQYRKTRTRDSGCCSINFTKYVLHILNIIFFLSGVAILGVAIWTVFWKHQYISLLATPNYLIGTYSLAVAGLLAIAAGIIGWCGIWREHRAIILIYTFLLLLVFLIESIFGGLAFLYEQHIYDELNMTLNDTFLTSYGYDVQRTNAIDLMQQEYECCGAIRFEDWRVSNWILANNQSLLRRNHNHLVPDSCCITLTMNCGMSDHPSNIPYTGCIYKMSDEIKAHLNILGSVALGVCIIQIFAAGPVHSGPQRDQVISLFYGQDENMMQATPSFLADQPEGVSLIYREDDPCPVHTRMSNGSRTFKAQPTIHHHHHQNGNGNGNGINYDGIDPYDVCL